MQPLWRIVRYCLVKLYVCILCDLAGLLLGVQNHKKPIHRGTGRGPKNVPPWSTVDTGKKLESFSNAHPLENEFVVT